MKIIINKKMIQFRKFDKKIRVHIYLWDGWGNVKINKMIILPNDKKQIPEIIKMIFKTPD